MEVWLVNFVLVLMMVIGWFFEGCYVVLWVFYCDGDLLWVFVWCFWFVRVLRYFDENWKLWDWILFCWNEISFIVCDFGDVWFYSEFYLWYWCVVCWMKSGLVDDWLLVILWIVWWYWNLRVVWLRVNCECWGGIVMFWWLLVSL